ncbi:MAG: Ldh family oxidoreductase [Lachnospiraceae bacterium]
MAKNTVTVSADAIKIFVTELFTKAGMDEKDAAFHAECLVKSNLWGIDSHGVLRAPAYFQRMLNGAINVKPNIQTVRGGKGLEVIDGDGGAGFVVAQTAMNRAIALAKEYNVGMVGVVNSNHFGAGALYARMAAEQGMIGFSMTNVLPLIVAPGASEPVVGNNPLAVAVPTYGDFPFCLDVSFSKVAGGKITLAMKKKEKIPMDWGTDSEGRPTDDPQKAHEGYLLPAAEHKGMGLAEVVDILSGVITGGVFSHQMKSMYANPTEPSLTGHFMIAINIDAIIGRDQMEDRMGEYYQRIKNTPMWDDTKQMYMPGEIEHIREVERKETGIPVPITTYEELMELKGKYRIQADLNEM